MTSHMSLNTVLLRNSMYFTTNIRYCAIHNFLTVHIILLLVYTIILAPCQLPQHTSNTIHEFSHCVNGEYVNQFPYDRIQLKITILTNADRCIYKCILELNIMHSWTVNSIYEWKASGIIIIFYCSLLLIKDNN